MIKIREGRRHYKVGTVTIMTSFRNQEAVLGGRFGVLRTLRPGFEWHGTKINFFYD